MTAMNAIKMYVIINNGLGIQENNSFVIIQCSSVHCYKMYSKKNSCAVP